MPTVDLPVGLWLEILSLLPYRYLRKLMSVSRTLFQIAMDEIYGEVKIISDDKRTVRTLEQLK